MIPTNFFVSIYNGSKNVLKSFNPFQLIATFHIDSSHLNRCANQINGFYVKCKIELKWVNVVFVKVRLSGIKKNTRSRFFLLVEMLIIV